ncbi:hypothetical protein BDV18DRAFT_140146 [Aspergillus unguis]
MDEIEEIEEIEEAPESSESDQKPGGIGTSGIEKPESEILRREIELSATVATPKRFLDWFIVDGECHYTQHSSLFSKYRAVHRIVTRSLPCGIFGTYVRGIGTLKLEVQCDREDRSKTHTLTLENVLHVPSAKCNGLNMRLYHKQYGGTVDTSQAVDDRGRLRWFTTPHCGFRRIVLGGKAEQTSDFVEGRSYWLHSPLTAEDVEEARKREPTEWEADIAAKAKANKRVSFEIEEGTARTFGHMEGDTLYY